MTVTVEICCDNAPFEDNLNHALKECFAIARMNALRMAKEHGPGMSPDSVKIIDSNGNTCGKVTVSE